MYIPKANQFTGKDEIIVFMKRFSFATIITATDNLPIAAHLPFLISEENDHIILTSHFARANPQWKDIETNKVLVIFSETHAYISPKHYDNERNVPTWNYVSVHAYGQGKIISDTDKVIELLERTINNYEAAYKQQWDSFPVDYKFNLSAGIVAFNITVTDLQAKKKLSQNRSPNEQQKIIHSLSNSEDTNEQLIAFYMKQHQLK